MIDPLVTEGTVFEFLNVDDQTTWGNKEMP